MARVGTGMKKERVGGVEFGKRLRAIRLERGITVQRLADAAGVLPSFINQLEAGDRVPSFSTLIHLINALEVSADELLYHYISHPDPEVGNRRIARLLQNASRSRLARIEAHIMLELSLPDNDH